MGIESQEERDRLAAELEAARTRLTELERKAYAGPYKAMWWLAKRRRTPEEQRLFPEKHFDDLPGSSLPEGIVVEKDVPIEMSDGVRLAANVFRPDAPGRFPVILTFTPYSKDYYGQHDPFGCSENTPFEGPDPGFWVPDGYVMVHIDDRGTGRSPAVGPAGPTISMTEWSGLRRSPWSNGAVGILGHSALAMRQWEVASMEEAPPHLKAIIPWGGFSDAAQDSTFPGGIPENGVHRRPRRESACVAEGFHTEAEASPEPVPATGTVGDGEPAKLENIKVPMLIGSSWIDYYGHLQGNLARLAEGFLRVQVALHLQRAEMAGPSTRPWRHGMSRGGSSIIS